MSFCRKRQPPQPERQGLAHVPEDDAKPRETIKQAAQHESYCVSAGAKEMERAIASLKLNGFLESISASRPVSRWWRPTSNRGRFTRRTGLRRTNRGTAGWRGTIHDACAVDEPRINVAAIFTALFQRDAGTRRGRSGHPALPTHNPPRARRSACGSHRRPGLREETRNGPHEVLGPTPSSVVRHGGEGSPAATP